MGGSLVKERAVGVSSPPSARERGRGCFGFVVLSFCILYFPLASLGLGGCASRWEYRRYGLEVGLRLQMIGGEAV